MRDKAWSATCRWLIPVTSLSNASNSNWFIRVDLRWTRSSVSGETSSYDGLFLIMNASWLSSSFGCSIENIKAQLPWPAGSAASVTVYVYGASDFMLSGHSIMFNDGSVNLTCDEASSLPSLSGTLSSMYVMYAMRVHLSIFHLSVSSPCPITFLRCAFCFFAAYQSIRCHWLTTEQSSSGGIDHFSSIRWF